MLSSPLQRPFLRIVPCRADAQHCTVDRSTEEIDGGLEEGFEEEDGDVLCGEDLFLGDGRGWTGGEGCGFGCGRGGRGLGGGEDCYFVCGFPVVVDDRRRGRRTRLSNFTKSIMPSVLEHRKYG